MRRARHRSPVRASADPRDLQRSRAAGAVPRACRMAAWSGYYLLVEVFCYPRLEQFRITNFALPNNKNLPAHFDQLLLI